MENAEFKITEDLLATKGQRFLNLILDILIVHTILMAIGTTVYLIGTISNSEILTNWAKSTTLSERVFFWILIMFLYYFLTEIYYSRTFAKYFTKTLVVKSDGSKPKMKTIIKRTLLRFIPFEGLTFFMKNFRGLHDFSSNTYVVRKDEFNKKRGFASIP